MKESEEQAALFNWAQLVLRRYPELDLLYHIPNGGSRHPAEAANLRRQGVKPGVPDLCLPVARGKYHGLYIEMKSVKNKPTPNQRRWLNALSENGYAVAVCYGWQEASAVIMRYLDGGVERGVANV